MVARMVVEALQADPFAAADREAHPFGPVDEADAFSRARSMECCHGSGRAGAHDDNIVFPFRSAHDSSSASAAQGHTFVHRPHPLQVEGSITRRSVRSSSEFEGQTLMHVPQRSHCPGLQVTVMVVSSDKRDRENL
jgi:hypothetical protein